MYHHSYAINRGRRSPQIEADMNLAFSLRQRLPYPLFTRLKLPYNHVANAIAGLVKEVENTQIQKEDKGAELGDIYNSQGNMGHENPADRSFIECIQIDPGSRAYLFLQGAR